MASGWGQLPDQEAEAKRTGDCSPPPSPGLSFPGGGSTVEGSLTAHLEEGSSPMGMLSPDLSLGL